MIHKIKADRVDLNGLRPEMSIAFMLACFVYSAHLVVCRLTCGTDSIHGRASKHYVGLAIDVGIKHPDGTMFTADLQAEIVADLKDSLGTQFDVVLEKDHIHIEFDPKSHVA